MKELYRKYFQKSHTFLYPLLGLRKRNHVRPQSTYISWDGHFTVTDRKLIALYTRENTAKWNDFEREFLITHPMLDYCIPVDEYTIIYVFDFNSEKDDFDAVVAGKYSTLSDGARKKISDFYGTHTPEWVYIESYLYPKKYFSIYAELLKVEQTLLETVGELCPPYDEVEEHCTENASSELPH